MYFKPGYLSCNLESFDGLTFFSRFTWTGFIVGSTFFCNLTLSLTKTLDCFGVGGVTFVTGIVGPYLSTLCLLDVILASGRVNDIDEGGLGTDFVVALIKDGGFGTSPDCCRGLRILEGYLGAGFLGFVVGVGVTSFGVGG